MKESWNCVAEGNKNVMWRVRLFQRAFTWRARPDADNRLSIPPHTGPVEERILAGRRN
jgi:hypothetical protein